METPKKVNHGNVFGTGNWHTFYCDNCGCQVLMLQDKCEDRVLQKGCGSKLIWK